MTQADADRASAARRREARHYAAFGLSLGVLIGSCAAGLLLTLTPGAPAPCVPSLALPRPSWSEHQCTLTIRHQMDHDHWWTGRVGPVRRGSVGFPVDASEPDRGPALWFDVELDDVRVAPPPPCTPALCDTSWRAAVAEACVCARLSCTTVESARCAEAINAALDVLNTKGCP